MASRTLNLTPAPATRGATNRDESRYTESKSSTYPVTMVVEFWRRRNHSGGSAPAMTSFASGIEVGTVGHTSSRNHLIESALTDRNRAPVKVTTGFIGGCPIG